MPFIKYEKYINILEMKKIEEELEETKTKKL